ARAAGARGCPGPLHGRRCRSPTGLLDRPFTPSWLSSSPTRRACVQGVMRDRRRRPRACVRDGCRGTVAVRRCRTMGRVTVGYQDGCVYPLWLSRVNIRLARLMGAAAVWLPDHFMSFPPAEVWRPEITAAARVVPSLDALFDPLQMLAITATRIRRIDVGTSVTEGIRRHPMSLAQSFVTLD